MGGGLGVYLGVVLVIHAFCARRAVLNTETPLKHWFSFNLHTMPFVHAFY